MARNSIGYYQYPKNGDGIIRSRTGVLLCSWILPRTQKALAVFKQDIQDLGVPGVYVLLNKLRVYVGEAGDLHSRLQTHMNNPDDKIRNWSIAHIITDGRFASLSLFNDRVVRMAIEYYLNRLLKTNGYRVVSKADRQSLTPQQASDTGIIQLHLNVYLSGNNMVSKFIDDPHEQEVFQDELLKLLKRAGKKVTKITYKEAVIDGEKVFIRPGSRKPKGWQVTIRGAKRDSFFDCFKRADGYLLVPRDGVLYIPLLEIGRVITDREDAFRRNTIDIFFEFQDQRAILKYKEERKDVSKYRLIS
ncbi:MAG: hypothetical protein ACTSYO_09435 [Candidatus Ranarchaeia archaeon]